MTISPIKAFKATVMSSQEPVRAAMPSTAEPLTSQNHAPLCLQARLALHAERAQRSTRRVNYASACWSHKLSPAARFLSHLLTSHVTL